MKKLHYNHYINQKLFQRQMSVFILVHPVKVNPMVVIALTSNHQGKVKQECLLSTRISHWEVKNPLIFSARKCRNIAGFHIVEGAYLHLLELVSCINLEKKYFIQKWRKIMLLFLPTRECFCSPAWQNANGQFPRLNQKSLTAKFKYTDEMQRNSTSKCCTKSSELAK